MLRKFQLSRICFKFTRVKSMIPYKSLRRLEKNGWCKCKNNHRFSTKVLNFFEYCITYDQYKPIEIDLKHQTMELRIYLSRLKLYLEHMYDLHMEIYVHIFSFSYVCNITVSEHVIRFIHSKICLKVTSHIYHTV